MFYDPYPRIAIMSRATKMKGSSQQAVERDNNSAMQQHMNRVSQQAVLTGSVAILWDMENCPVPSEVKADDVAGNIRMALRLHPVIQGAVTFFSAYGDFNHFPRKVREGCQRTGVNLIDVPNGKKDASDKAILVDLFLFALDNAPPCTIFLISGDVDFAPALHKLGQRGYSVVLAIPSGVGVSSALCSAGRFVWDWPSVAKGGGLIPAKTFSSRSSVDERTAEIIEINGSAGYPGPVWSHDDDSDLASDDHEEEHIVWKSPAPKRALDQGITDTAQQQRNSASSSTHSSGSGKSPPFAPYPPAPREQSSNQTYGARETVTVARESVRAQSNGKGSSKNSIIPTENNTQVEKSLRDQLVRLLSLNGQKMELSRVPAEYQKQFGISLAIGDYGHSGTALVNLLERLKEWMFMREGATKTLHLTKTGSRVAAKLKREANKNSRGPPKEEVEVNLINFIDSNEKSREKDVGDDDDETAGEEVVVGCATKGMQTLIMEGQSRLPGDKKHPQQKREEHNRKELEEIHLPSYDWGFGSGGSGGSGDEKDNLPEDAKDVEVDECTLEHVVKSKKGNNNRPYAGGLDILDVFRLELQDLLVSFACKIPMTSLLELYQIRYSKPLDYEKFGVKDLESLVEKVSDVAEVTEMDIKDLEEVIEKVSDVAEVFMEDKKSKLKVLVAHRSYDFRISEKQP